MLDIAIAAPPNYNDLTMPTGYLDARADMRQMGKIMVQIIEEQPNQRTTSQILTAQTIKDIGRGWSSVFEVATQTPSNPRQDEVRFQWQPGGEMRINMPEAYPSGFCEQAIRPLARASVWRYLMQIMDKSQRINQVEGNFRIEISNLYEGQIVSSLDDYGTEAITEMARVLFRLEGSKEPLFEKVTIDWGDDIGACLNELYQKRKSS